MCPVKTLIALKRLSVNNGPDCPVFSFNLGKNLTLNNLNDTIRTLLEVHLGPDSGQFSGHSFRAAIPVVLAKYPLKLGRDHGVGPLEVGCIPVVHKTESRPEEESLPENINHVKLVFYLGPPTVLEEEDLTSNLTTARDIIREETIRTRPHNNTTTRDPASTISGIHNTDLEAMKRKFLFLLEYSDEFIRDTGIHILIKAETASCKLQDMDSRVHHIRVFF